MSYDTHRNIWAFERHSETMSKRFVVWADLVREELGLASLDGDQRKNGFSLDRAYELWRARYSPKAAANDFRASMSVLGRGAYVDFVAVDEGGAQ